MRQYNQPLNPALLHFMSCFNSYVLSTIPQEAKETLNSDFCIEPTSNGGTLYLCIQGKYEEHGEHVCVNYLERFLDELFGAELKPEVAPLINSWLLQESCKPFSYRHRSAYWDTHNAEFTTSNQGYELKGIEGLKLQSLLAKLKLLDEERLLQQSLEYATLAHEHDSQKSRQLRW